MTAATLHIPLIIEESLHSGRITAKLIFVKSFETYQEAVDYFAAAKVEISLTDELKLVIER